mmetsp:Transcript_5073/g.15236  ORF Transcript_5073/g.15236 Transcript_5073/m.15236 type:complete len:207 (-) Transcript_5073:667-1287(-)
MGTTLRTKLLFSLKASPKVPSPTFRTEASHAEGEVIRARNSSRLGMPPSPAPLVSWPHSTRSSPRSLPGSGRSPPSSSIFRLSMTPWRESRSPSAPSSPLSSMVPMSFVSCCTSPPSSSTSSTSVSNFVLSLSTDPFENLAPYPCTLSLLMTTEDLLFEALLELYEKSPPRLASKTAFFAGSGDSSTSSYASTSQKYDFMSCRYCE